MTGRLSGGGQETLLCVIIAPSVVTTSYHSSNNNVIIETHLETNIALKASRLPDIYLDGWWVCAAVSSHGLSLLSPTQITRNEALADLTNSSLIQNSTHRQFHIISRSRTLSHLHKMHFHKLMHSWILPRIPVDLIYLPFVSSFYMMIRWCLAWVMDILHEGWCAVSGNLGVKRFNH